MAEYLKRPKAKQIEDLRAVQDTVREILERVRKEGVAAVREYSSRFDNWSPESFKVTEDEMRAAKSKLPATEVADIDFCQAQIRNFAREQMNRLVDFEVETLPGVHLGQKIIPPREMPVDRRRRHIRRLGRLGQGEALRPLLGDQRQRRLDQRLAEVAVVVSPLHPRNFGPPQILSSTLPMDFSSFPA